MGVKPRGGSGLDRRTQLAGGLIGLVAIGLVLAYAEIGFLLLMGSVTVAVLIIIALNKPMWFCIIALGTIFLSRFSVDAGGFNVRAEIIVGLVASIAIVAKPGSVDRKIDSTFLLIIGCWISWLVIVTFLVGPSFTDSMTVLVWLFLNVATVTYLVMNIDDLRVFVSFGIWFALASAIGGLVLWLLATFGSVAWLVQVDPTYSGYAVYATAYEANILASLVTLWSVVAISSRLCANCSDVSRISLILVTPFLAVATHTRIALVASVLVIGASVILYPRSRVYIVMLAVLAACAAAVAAVDLEQIGLSKFSGQFSLNEGTGKYRSDSWVQAREDINRGGWESSLLGLGANSFGQRHLDPTLIGTGARWYLGNLPLQIFYDGGLIAVVLVALAFFQVFPIAKFKLALVFVAVYALFAVSTSTLWLMQSWIFLAIVMVDTQDRTQSEKMANA